MTRVEHNPFYFPVNRGSPRKQGGKSPDTRGSTTRKNPLALEDTFPSVAAKTPTTVTKTRKTRIERKGKPEEEQRNSMRQLWNEGGERSTIDRLVELVHPGGIGSSIVRGDSSESRNNQTLVQRKRITG